ncbi:MAG: sulfatase-like hydrolase/transferase, partial [Kiritimatiellales bacterium]|nr:sulfatase-like hydrolase/transferase [Kiritimatiellales bacterium]
EGIRLTDAHAAAAVCQPSRYAILSGRYYWRSTPNPGYSYYFDEGEKLLPQLLKEAGYRTAGFGKWHLGFGSPKPADMNGALTPGTREAGFDYYFGLPRSHNEPPFVFFENDHVYQLDPDDPLVMVPHEKMPKGSDYGWGGSRGAAKAHAARPEDQIDLILTDRVVEFVGQQSPDKPFFIYLPFTAPHYPITPNNAFIGTSEADRYGDFVQQLDACVGRVLEALEKKGLKDNTLVMLTSDNGAVNTGEPVAKGHHPNGILLGQKTDAWDGGHKVPFIVRWPGRLPSGKISGILFGLEDLMATILAAADVPMPGGAGLDSLNQLPALEGKAPFVRTEMVYQGVLGFALRKGPWVYVPADGSQGFTTDRGFGVPYEEMGFRNSSRDKTGRLLPNAPPDQLYNVHEDPGQHLNVVREYPEQAKSMAARLLRIVGPNPRNIVH